MTRNSGFKIITDNFKRTKYACVIDIKDMDISQGGQPYNNSTQQLHEKPDNVPGCFGCLQRKTWMLPTFTAVWLILSIFISYAVSEALGHQTTDFPYISHTAIDDPERSIFSITINIGAVLLGLNAALRYLYIKHTFRKIQAPTRWHKANRAALILGIISAFGLSMVANFQTVLQKPPHYIGAALAFVGGNIYCWVHSAISYYLWKQEERKPTVFISQLTISTFMFIFLLMFGASKLSYKLQETSGSRKIVTPSLNGLYLTSTVTEWLLAISVSLFLFTFVPDSCTFKIKAPTIEDLPLISECNEEKNGNLKNYQVELTNIKTSEQ